MKTEQEYFEWFETLSNEKQNLIIESSACGNDSEKLLDYLKEHY